MAGEGEGEPQRQSSTFHSHVVQEVGDAVHNVIKELERDMLLVVYILGDRVRLAFLFISRQICLSCLLWNKFPSNGASTGVNLFSFQKGR